MGGSFYDGNQERKCVRIALMERDYTLQTIIDQNEYVFDEEVVITNERGRIILYLPELDLEITLSGVEIA